MQCEFGHFQELIGLHKFYFELLIDSAAFYLGIVGAMVAYVAKGDPPPHQVRFSLVVPLILSTAACVGYAGGHFQLLDLVTWIRGCQETLELDWAPHVEQLASLSLFFSFVAGLVTIGLVVILAKPRLFLRHDQAD